MKIVVHEEVEEKVKKPRPKFSLSKKAPLGKDEALLADIKEAKAKAEESMRKSGELGEGEELQVDALQQLDAGYAEKAEDIVVAPTSEPEHVMDMPEPEPVMAAVPESEPAPIVEAVLEQSTPIAEAAIEQPTPIEEAVIEQPAEEPAGCVETPESTPLTKPKRKPLMALKTQEPAAVEAVVTDTEADEEIEIAGEEVKPEVHVEAVQAKQGFATGMFVLMLGACLVAQFGVNYGVQQLVAKLISQTLGG